MGETILQKLLGRRRHPRIFLSYRRHGDGAGYGGRLADALVEYFGRDQCFVDLIHIAAGQDFVQKITEGVSTCEVLVVVIGPDWTTQTDGSGRPRLQTPNDFVRIEVAAALKRGVSVIPVLVGGAYIPAEDQLPDDLKALTRRQVHELSDSRWAYDTRILLQTIESGGIKSLASSGQLALRQKMKAVAAAVIAGGVVLTAVIVVANWGRPKGSPAPPGDSATAQAIKELTRGWKESESVAIAEREKRDKLAQQLHQAEKDKEAAARMAEQAKREKREAELRAEQERAAKKRIESILALQNSPPVTRAAGSPARPCGIAVVSWWHANARYRAGLRLGGPHSTALVEYTDKSGAFHRVEQDIHPARSGDLTLYEGSKPRAHGTNLFHANFDPNIFRLERVSNGAWNVKEVGVAGMPGHFDKSEPGAVSSLADCK